MIDKDRVLSARRQGLSFVCATCPHWHEARDRGVPGTACLQDCRGPLVGGDFERYNGLLTDTDKYCFVCGAVPTRWVRALTAQRYFGICSSCYPLVSRLEPALDVPAVLDVRGAPPEVAVPSLAEHLVRLAQELESKT